MSKATDEILKIITDNQGILIGSDVCAHCFGSEIKNYKFILIKLDWRSGGKDYKSVGLFICEKCAQSIQVDQKKLLQNLLYMLEEFHKEVI